MAGVGAFTGICAVLNSIANTIFNRRTSKTVQNLDEGKLDLSVAELGHTVLMGLLAEVRREVQDCHEERDELRSILQAHGLIPK